MARLTFKKWFERFKPDEETTTILINGYTQINEPIYETDQIYPKAMNYYLIGAAVDKLAAYEDAEEAAKKKRMIDVDTWNDKLAKIISDPEAPEEYKDYCMHLISEIESEFRAQEVQAMQEGKQ